MQETEQNETTKSEIEEEASYDPARQQLMIICLHEGEVVTDSIIDAPEDQIRFLEDFVGNILIEFTNEDGEVFTFPEVKRKGARSLALQSRLLST